MTIRNLEYLLRPTSVVVVGASPKPGSIGNTIVRNLRDGGFAGTIQLVNPRHSSIDGHPCVASVRNLSAPADIAVIATPAATIAPIAADLARHGTKGLVIVSAGVTAQQRQDILNAGKAACVRVLGPNGIGLLVPPIGLNASFVHRSIGGGKLAFLSQSGALVTAVIDWAASRALGFSHVVSLGDMADVDFGDLLDYLAGDPGCSAILLYIEAITHARKFMSAARRAARVKPVIALKAGRHAAAARAAQSHTGALAGSDAAYTAAFRRAGILRVKDLHDLFSAAEMLSKVGGTLGGERLTILTNGGGAGVLATDCLADADGTLATLSPETLAALDAVLPAHWSRGNPVDVIGDADATRYAAALDILLRDPSADALLVMNCPTALTSSSEIARTVIDQHKGKPDKVLLTNWLGADSATDSRRLFAAADIATFDTPGGAIDGVMQLVRHRRAQEALMRTPPAFDPTLTIDRPAAEAVLRDARAAGRLMLSEPESKAVLAAYGIPAVETKIASTPTDAATVARGFLTSGGSVVLKILSDDITHKSDVGGVRLGLDTPEAVAAAAHDMQARIARSHPDARLRGFTVSPFVQRPRAHELILGINADRTFGPLILFGAGGTSVEAVADTALALPPLDLLLAQDLMQHTRIHKLLRGYRDRPAADLPAIRQAVVRLSILAANHPEILELDINPLLADASGVVALDARIRLVDDPTKPTVPMAVRPYPSQWCVDERLGDLGMITIRPIRPDDEHLYDAFFEKVTPKDRRLRLFTPLKHLTHGFVARLTQIDYAREIAFVAIAARSTELLGVVRYSADPDLTKGEFAILVRSDLKGQGLGWRLMQHLIAYAKAERIGALTGTVLEENTRMLEMCRELGFQAQSHRGDPGVLHVELTLA